MSDADENKENTLELQTSFETRNGVSVTSSGFPPDTMELDRYELVSSIEDNIIKGIMSIPFDHQERLNKFIENNEHQKAADYLEENSHIFFFINKAHESFLDTLLKVDLSLIDEKSKFNFLKFIIGVASQTRCFGPVEQIADLLLKEYSKDLEDEHLQLLIGVMILKGNAAIENNKQETASIYYHKALTYEGIESGSKAWVLNNLSLFPDVKDHKKRELINQAIDCFLESGQKDEAIKCYVRIAEELDFQHPEEAIKSLDIAVSLMNSQEKVDQEKKAQIHFHKAKYLHQIGRFEDAYLEVNKTINIREHFLGNNRAKASSYYLASILAEVVDKENFEGIKLKQTYYENLADRIDEPLYSKIAKWLSSSELENAKLEEEVAKSGDYFAIFSFFESKAIKQQDPILSIECLDTAKEALENIKGDNECWTALSFHYAETFRQLPDKKKAIFWYQKTLDHNPFHPIASQNLAALLQQECLWVELKEHFEKHMQLFGELPNTCFLFGRTLLQLGDAHNALKYLLKAKKLNADIDIEEDKNKALELIADSQGVESETGMVVTTSDKESHVVTTRDIMSCLEDFSVIVSDRRMQFWRKEGKVHKFKNSPEEIGKELFINFLFSRFGNDVIIVDEYKAGAGRIDIFLAFSTDLKIIVELKMCGQSYSENYALEGIEQLAHYMKIKSVFLGYLVVFDARVKDFGNNLKDPISQGSSTIFPKAVDIRNIYKH